MTDPVISCFKEEFDRFFGMLEKQIDICPEDLWNQKVGGYVFWQQQLHVLACTLLYARPDGRPFEGLPYQPAVLMLSGVPDFNFTKREMRLLAEEAKETAHKFIDKQTTASLTDKHELISAALGRELTNQTALIALIRHLCYHLGSCDAALRDKGLAGVY